MASKIVRIITRLNIGGPAVHAALLSSRLDPARFSTCLVVGQPDRGEGDRSGLLEGANVRVRRIAALRRPLRPWFDLLAFGRLLRILWQERPQIIHTHTAKAGALGRLAGACYNLVGPGRKPGSRAVVVHTFHGHVLSGYFPLWLSRVFVIIERWLARRTDWLIAVSPAIQRELLEKEVGRPAQWRTIPIGLDLAALSRLPFPNGAAPSRVGLVGRLVPIKNPTLFLDALAEVRRRHPEAAGASHLVVGDGSLRRSLEESADRLGLRPGLEFTGWRHDPCAIYGALDVVCLTSWNEGTPVSLIEAMAAGRAVVATAVGGVPDLLDGEAAEIPAGGFRLAARGLLIRPGDREGLAAALTALAWDPALRERLGREGRRYALEQFGSERLIRDLTMFYESIVGRDACRP